MAEEKKETLEMTTEGGVRLSVTRLETPKEVEVTLRKPPGERCLLHWGLCRSEKGPWQMPPKGTWPEGSAEFGDRALQSPFRRQDGDESVVIRVRKASGFRSLGFVLYFPEAGRWDNNRGQNYYVALPASGKTARSPAEALKEETGAAEVAFEEHYRLDEAGSLAACLVREAGKFRLTLITDMPSLILHWGISRESRFEWLLPPEAMWPPGTRAFDDRAVQSPFAEKGGLYRAAIEFAEEGAPLGIPFVLREKETGAWIKNRGRNFYVPVRSRGESPFKGNLASVAEEIVDAEMSDRSWTLMHRFNLCYDLLDRARDDVEGLALLFVWLRFSALRQLDWQRKYNTKPRELAHAQDRLTLKFAELYINHPPEGREPEVREMLRLLMTTLGRGGEGQRVRDEVLNIMHRHHIKEVSGHFLEEWHQKLHNNTTPDDIVICMAYLEFLRSGGNLDRFYETLKAGGVTKERLESFDRPIVSHPDFIADKKDALIHDFQEFLKILNSVHSATDLRSAADTARYLLDGETAADVDFLLARGGDPNVSPLELSGRLTGARLRLGGRLGEDRDPGRVRDMLFLDISLEEFLRTVVERNIQNLEENELVDSAALAARNIALTHGGFEFYACQRHWEKLRGMERFGRDWSLHAASVLERMGRAVNGFTDRYQGLFQPKALYLGKAFGAEPWTVNLFTEELIRGRLVFVLSLLFRRLSPALRRHAGLGDWQVISLARAAGTVEVAPDLRSVQGRSYRRPTVIITDRVRGDEEPPQGVAAVITSGTVDLVSHVAIRARNAGMLFASCYDRERVEELKALAGKAVSLSVDAKGDVIVGEAGGEEGPGSRARRLKREISRPHFRAYAIGAEDFREGLVGGKSLNVQRLRGRLPDWMMLPRSAAIPFGAFEKVLSLEANRSIRQRCEELLGLVEGSPPEILSQMREAVMGLEAPEELFVELEAVLGRAGLAMPSRQETWRCIKGVWASKWTERAYLSRVTWGIPHEDLFMAVLVQEVVDAEYAFVIHTANPFTGAPEELYAELVLGLGEALAGNYPGRAMGFTARKDQPEPRLLSYPSKSEALHGGGLIFRSDSNGEDLVGYAGAGLYESVMVSRPQRKPVDYTEERLVWDGGFRDRLLSAIAGIGISVEAAMGSAQDIEGAYEGGRYHVLQTRPQITGNR